jgi:hypothetical protein
MSLRKTILRRTILRRTILRKTIPRTMIKTQGLTPMRSATRLMTPWRNRNAMYLSFSK